MSLFALAFAYLALEVFFLGYTCNLDILALHFRAAKSVLTVKLPDAGGITIQFTVHQPSKSFPDPSANIYVFFA